MKTKEDRLKAFEELNSALGAQLSVAPEFEAAARKFIATSTAVGKAAAEAGINPPKRSELLGRMSRCMAQAGRFEA
ncbi:MAG: hypothetical protein WD944_06490 [Steroidobacteraceae bacterium]